MPDDPSPPDSTLHQPEHEQEGSKELSLPSGVEQHPSAPKIPGYVLLRPLGRGAFAEVWKAWQVRTRKNVAVKVFTQRQGINWLFLRREVERLVRLDRHPNVVSLLDADLSGEPGYYVMDLLEEGSLEGALSAPVPVERAAAWMEDVAKALAYVHAKGLIHCDLKPANILLDEEKRVRVADFGQSRIVTDSAGALGTLFYMAPEQAAAEDDGAEFRADVRWDVFALGATLYAVLSGKPPFSEHRAELECLSGLRDRLRAYRRLVMQAPLADLRALTRGAVDEDLAAIVSKCAAPGPEARYQTMAEVLADLERRRRRLPVSPLAGSRAYRTRRFLQRNALLVALGTACLCALAWGLRQVALNAASQRAELAYSYRLRGRQAALAGEEGDAALLFAKSNELLPSAGARREAVAFLTGLARPARELRTGAPVDALCVGADGRAILTDSDQRPQLWGGGPRPTEYKAPPEPPDGMRLASAITPGLRNHRPELSPDGTRTLLRPEYGQVVLADAAGLRHIAAVPGDFSRLSPDGALFAVSEDAYPPRKAARVTLYSAADGRPTGVAVTHPGAGTGTAWTAFSPDGRVFLTCSGGSVRFWDTATGRRAGPAIAYEPESRWAGEHDTAEFSPDGRTILSANAGRAQLYDRATGRPVGKPMRHDGPVTAAALTKDGRRVVTAGEDGTVRLWTASGEGAGRPAARGSLRHHAAVSALALSPDGRLAATASDDGTARLWSLDPWEPFGLTMLHGAALKDLAFSADGKTLVTGAQDGTVRAWPVPQAPVGHTRRKSLAVAFATFDPAGERVLVASERETRLEEAAGGRVVSKARYGVPPGAFTEHVRFDRSGRRLIAAAGMGAREASVWDAAEGKRLAGPFRNDDAAHRAEPYWGEIQAVDLSADGNLAATAGGSLGVGLIVWDAASGKSLGSVPVGYVHDVRFSPDGRRLAVAEGERTLVYDLPLSKTPALILAHGKGRVHWSPDGTRLATVGGKGNREVRLWDARSGQALGPGADFSDYVDVSAFSPDGARFAAGGRDGTVRLLAAADGAPVGLPLRHQAACGAFSPDSSVLATGGGDGLVRLWDARTGDPIGNPLRQGGLVGALAFSADGRTLHSHDEAEAEFVSWDLSWLYAEPSPAALLEQASAADGKRLDARGLPLALPPPKP